VNTPQRWYRGGPLGDKPRWLTPSRAVADFYGPPVHECAVAGTILDLRQMGVDVDDDAVPVQVETSSGEAYEWAELAWKELRRLGYDGVMVKQWHADFGGQAYTALLYWGD
jgi:hypothetical protein